MSWTVDVLNPRTGDDFVLGLKEIALPDGVTRPFSMWRPGADSFTWLTTLHTKLLSGPWSSRHRDGVAC